MFGGGRGSILVVVTVCGSRSPCGRSLACACALGTRGAAGSGIRAVCGAHRDVGVVPHVEARAPAVLAAVLLQVARGRLRRWRERGI